MGGTDVEAATSAAAIAGGAAAAATAAALSADATTVEGVKRTRETSETEGSGSAIAGPAATEVVLRSGPPPPSGNNRGTRTRVATIAATTEALRIVPVCFEPCCSVVRFPSPALVTWRT